MSVAQINKTTPTEEELMKWLRTPEGFIQGLLSVDDQPISITEYQLAHLMDKSTFRIRNKARGVGFSYIIAIEALAKAHIRNDYTAIFVSINHEEAVEKIRYANMLYESLPLRWRKKKIIDNRTSIEFEDAAGKFRSRLISHPCKDPRGKHKADVFLDEFAHYGNKQNAVYVASVPIVSRGKGQLTIGSTPLAAGDLYHDIMMQEHKKYPMFSRQSIPWWACPDFCVDVKRAMMEAPKLETSQRVAAFGKQVISDIYQSLAHEDFQQEYELAFQDESQTYYPYELIFSCCSDELETYATMEQLVKNTKGELYAGFDVGRTKHKSELIVLERVNDRLYYRMGKSFDKTKFQEQEKYLRNLCNISRRLKRLCIDRHGIGMNLAENMHGSYGSRAEGLALIGQVKEVLAVDLHIGFENGELQLPRDRDLTAQIHSVRKMTTTAGFARYDTEGNEDHHADKMWALALAVHAAGLKDKQRKRRREVLASVV